MPTPRRAFTELCHGRKIVRLKAERRAFHRRQREHVRVGILVRWINSLNAMPKAEKEWRVLLLIGPDTRSLTGRLLGDPRYERSGLFFKRGVTA